VLSLNDESRQGKTKQLKVVENTSSNQKKFFINDKKLVKRPGAR